MKLNQMNQAQQQAVLHGEGPLLVLAGPGSGKTFTITQRILYLIEELQVPPEEILVITFTKDAALSMQRRFIESSNRSYPVNFGTFHSIFYHILQAAGCFGTGQILGESQKKKIIFPIMKKMKMPCNERADNLPKQNSAYSQNIFAEDITSMLSAISYYKNTGNQEGAVQKLSMDWQILFSEIYEEYDKVRRQQHALDFDDMVYECEKLLRTNKQQREYWQKRFTHILMDEFQDINPMQYRVIKLLSSKPYNLFAVGDDDQAIYGFRGSKPACLRQFVEDYRAKQILLNVNYRSDRSIIKTSLLVIEENKERFFKELEAFSQSNGYVQLHSFMEREEQYQYLIDTLSGRLRLQNTDSLKQKSAVIAKTMQEKEGCTVSFMEGNAEAKNENYAVLFRTNSFMQGFAARLKREGIAFEMKEGQSSIYEHFVIKDIMAYLRLAAGERDKKLWLQILNKPSRYISREALSGAGSEPDIRAIREFYRKCPTTAGDFAYMEKIQNAIQLLEKQLEYLKKAPPYLAVQYVWKVVGYERYLRTEWLRNIGVGRGDDNMQNGGLQTAGQVTGMERNREKLEEFEELFLWLKEDARHYDTLAEWQAAQQAYGEQIFDKKTKLDSEKCEGIALMKKGEGERNQRPKIHLMTVHASKGLEFDRVWIPDCNEKIFPHGAMPDKEAVEEERRIFYVAMTRAKKSLELLYLTGTKERPRLPSRFLNPLLEKYKL